MLHSRKGGPSPIERLTSEDGQALSSSSPQSYSWAFHTKLFITERFLQAWKQEDVSLLYICKTTPNCCTVLHATIDQRKTFRLYQFHSIHAVSQQQQLWSLHFIPDKYVLTCKRVYRITQVNCLFCFPQDLSPGS